MIDYQTYKNLHPDSSDLWYSAHYKAGLEKPDEVYQPRDPDGPKEPEIYVFPGRIPGFNLRRKKWGMFFVCPGIKPILTHGNNRNPQR